MANSLKDLLAGAIKRANISRGVTAAQIVTDANILLAKELPPEAKEFAKVISYVDGIINVACLQSAVSQFVSQRGDDILRELKSRHPSAQLERIRTRVVSHFPSSEL